MGRRTICCLMHHPHRAAVMGEQEKNPFKGHTEGPWDIEHPCGFPYTGTYIVSHKANEKKGFHHYILEVRQLRERAESDANAALVKAAPTLLSQRNALVRVLEKVNHTLVVHGHMDVDTDLHKSIISTLTNETQ